MNKPKSIGDRMKRYELSSQQYLTRRTPVIVRVDGKSFHTFTKGMDRPFDLKLSASMINAAISTCKVIQGCKLAYGQSDEVSFLLTDFDRLSTDAYFDYRLDKVVSIIAATMTVHFNNECRGFFPDKLLNSTPIFDARAFNIPKEDVVNYFIWRQQDATRNSIQMVGQAHFSHKQLHKKSCDDIQEMLFKEKGINWNDTSTEFKRGWVACKRPTTDGELVWSAHLETPIFTQDREYIEKLMEIEEDKDVT